jgi:predicted metalloendopeptidase
MFRTRPFLAAAAALTIGGLAACPSGKSGDAKTGGGTLKPPNHDGDGTGSATEAKTVAVSLEDVGLESASMDKSADPCTDFYQYACGGWIAQNPIPADKARYARFTEITDRNENTLHEILEDAAAGKSGDDPLMTSLGHFYQSCMDEPSIEKNGLKGARPLLETIKKVKDGKTLEAALITLHNSAVDAVFGAGGLSDFNDSTMNVLWVDGSGLGLPDRDYYFKDEFKDKVEAYRTHVGKVFKLLGRNAKVSAAATANVLAIETKLADATKTGVEKRDIPKLYNPYAIADLAKLTPHFDWTSYLTGRGNGQLDKVIVATPAFFTRFDEMIGGVKASVWQDYLTYHVVDALAFGLGKKFDDEDFAFKKQLSGVTEQRERWKRCVSAVGGAMPEGLAQPYIDRMFPGESKQSATETVANIASAFDDNLASIDWMSAETKAAARGKLAKLSGMIGYPDNWRVYDFEVTADNFAANEIAGASFEARRQFMKANTPVDRTEWTMPAYIVNAYYDPTGNLTALPAGILQPPFWGKDRSVAANMGGIGMVVGHELTHGFDDQGAQFDAGGNMSMWWQKDDFAKFQAKGKCVADQYSTFEVLPGKFVNGELTLGENIADLGGIKVAFGAYRKIRANAPERYVADGFTEDQQFFLGVGQAWCSQDRPEESLKRITTDPHSPPKFRVYGALANNPDFAEAFNCPQGSKMRPKKMCSVW